MSPSSASAPGATSPATTRSRSTTITRWPAARKTCFPGFCGAAKAPPEAGGQPRIPPLFKGPAPAVGAFHHHRSLQHRLYVADARLQVALLVLGGVQRRVLPEVLVQHRSPDLLAHHQPLFDQRL